MHNFVHKNNMKVINDTCLFGKCPFIRSNVQRERTMDSHILSTFVKNSKFDGGQCEPLHGADTCIDLEEA